MKRPDVRKVSAHQIELWRIGSRRISGSCDQVFFDDGKGLGKGADITGQRFGLLVAQRVVERTSKGCVWLLLCDCGNYARRSTGRLRQSIRQGSEPMCRQCYEELRRGQTIVYIKNRTRTFIAMWSKDRSLWSTRSDEILRNKILSDCAERIGVVPEEEPERLPLYGYDLGHALGMIEDERKRRERDSRYARRERDEQQTDIELARLKRIAQEVLVVSLARGSATGTGT